MTIQEPGPEGNITNQAEKAVEPKPWKRSMRRDDNRGFWMLFFSIDNPFWTLIPIMVSILALWFAYKSTTISRESADVHLRITTFMIMGYPVAAWNHEQDGKYLLPGVLGSGESLQKMVVDNPFGVAINSLHMRWGAMSAGVDLDQLDLESLAYNEYYHYLVITNNSDQIADGLKVEFDHFVPDDPEEFRGREIIPEGADREPWVFGPAPIAPGQTVLIPMGSSYVRYDPTQNDPNDLYRNFDVQYFGEFYEPKGLSYISTVSGPHTMTLDFKTILPVTGAFEDPPEGPVGELAQEANEEFQSQLSENAEDIVQNLAPDQADGGGAGDAGDENDGSTPNRGKRQRSR